MKYQTSLFLLVSSSLTVDHTIHGFAIVPNQQYAATTTTSLHMANKVGVFYGTSTGSTETAADMLAERLGADGPFDVDESGIAESLRQYDSLIVGTPTWNTGADTERSGTGWDELYYDSMSDLDMTGKKVAVFGLGDSVSYAENFSDAAGELHDVFEKLGCQMHGYVSQEGYLHEDSKAIRGDKFCGLLLDMVNQEELTEGRIENWVDQLIDEGFMEGGSATTTESSSSEAPVVDDVLAKLEADSSVLDETIASHDTGYVPHTNPSTGKTMWTSPDGRSSYVTEGGTSTVMKTTGLYF